MPFLVTDTRLETLLCPSVRPWQAFFYITAHTHSSATEVTCIRLCFLRLYLQDIFVTKCYCHQMLLSFPIFLHKKKKRMAHGLVAWLLKWFLWAGGIPLRRKRVLGRKVTQERAAIIVAAPHASIWDAGTVSLACGMPSFVSRVENRSVPIIGSKGS